jgi:predicted TIM-barrel fold metal-dependent hydrolase
MPRLALRPRENSYLFRPENIPVRAAFPAIDAHNHLWGGWRAVPHFVRAMNRVGIAMTADLTSNLKLSMGKGGYVFAMGEIEDFFQRCARPHPDRFYAFTTATFSRPVAAPLFTDARRFVEETCALMQEHVAHGARGLKILKELGLHYRDGRGKIIVVDDERLAPIWEEAGRLGVPVLIHQSDPYGFFEPAKPGNEHCETLRKFPSWSFADRRRFPRKWELIRRRDRLVSNHPHTQFILPHVANFPEHLDYVSGLLDSHPNVSIDFSARLDEIGRQPYTAREFFLRNQDRILFGTDMPPSEAMYRCHFRFLETWDEFFFPPDYDGTFNRHRWYICGIGLPRSVLQKIYHRNILRLIPSLRPAYEASCRLLDQ